MDGKRYQDHLVLQSVGFLSFWKQNHIITTYAFDYKRNNGGDAGEGCY